MAEELLAPVWSASDSTWNFERAAHLIRRAGFGGTPAEIDALVAMGAEKAVNSIIDYHAITDDLPELPREELALPAKAAVASATKPSPETATAPKPTTQQAMLANLRANGDLLRLWWLDRMVRTRRPLEEKMTLFWHGLLVSSAQSVRNPVLLYDQNQLFRRFAVGNFRVLIHEVSRNPAMLQYLNNAQNVKAHPNENYARELMELFTLGIGNYSENDVKESARAFTGWSNAGESFVARPGQHDGGIKTFLGRVGNFDGDQIIDIIFQQKAAPRHLAARILRFFAVDEPPVEVINSLAAVVERRDFVLAPVLRTLFSSRWFYSRDVVRQQIKSPVQLVVGAVRELGTSLNQPQQILNGLRLMGQDLFNAPSVKGWDGGRAWISTSTLFARYNLPTYLALNRPAVAAAQAVLAGTKFPFLEVTGGWNPRAELADALVATTDGVVDFYVKKLLGFDLEAPERADLTAYLNGTGSSLGRPFTPNTPESERRVRGLVSLIMALPEFQLC